MDTIKFNPEKIAEIAAEIQLQLNLLHETVALVKRENDEMAYFWMGECSDQFRKKMSELDGKTEQLHIIMSNLYVDMFNTAGIYQVSEMISKIIVEGLPTEGVFL